MNCVYCFQRYDNKDIKNIKIGEYSKIISKHIDDKENEIIIFGGEPFIDKNIENLQYLFDVANMKNKLSFFTNGCYSIKIDELIKNNKSSINHLTITLDGPERIHNN
ncbi:4Fe-4S cluster-binding domain-containing protein [Clostridium sp. MSJ-4]|uniref:4Fe-4S cluster-binding domain-containing protein n=1 Tax=Clostridium simiarum TaxID=2841506 RepID=A0ABS6F1S5_9CLOT|nr:4Fe-4S cluster-binding domain-containing protein [Clostridium simiarum]